MSNAPAISVLLSVHNGMPYLPLAVESVLSQTFEDFELLLIDDGSTDETPAYLASLADPRVRVERLEKVGLPAALNHGLRIARGRLIARLDADDICYPQRLQKQYGYFESHPGCVLISCHFDCIDENGAVVGEGYNPVSDAAARWLLLFTAAFVHPGAMFDRDAALGAGGYNPEYRLAQDYDLWTRLAPQGQLGNVPAKLIGKRVHGNTHGATNATKQRDFASRIAGDYAATVRPELRAPLMSELYRFLWWGELPRESTLDDLVGAYRLSRQHFVDQGGGDTELLRFVTFIDEKLRWRCLEQAKVCIWRPWEATRWLHLAGAFDTDEGGVARIILRRMKRLLRRQPAPAPVGVRFFAPSPVK